MRLLRGEGAWLPGGRTRYRLERTSNRRDGAVTGRTVLGSGCCGERRGLRARELGDDAAAEQAAVRVVQGARLSWRDGPHRLGEVEGDRAAHLLPHPAGDGRGAVAALYQNRIPRRQRIGEPVELRERHGVAEQLVPRADHDFARLRADRDHVHRLAEPAGEAATLPDGIAREARVLPHHVAACRHQRPRRERRRVGVLERHLPADAPALTPGPLVTAGGDVVGEHAGFARYTIGQRRGLPGGFREPMYVVAIRPETREVVIGSGDELFGHTVTLAELNWLADALAPGDAVLVQCRYRAPAVPGRVREQVGGAITLDLAQLVRAITPGQSGALYDADGRLLGGGVIA